MLCCMSIYIYIHIHIYIYTHIYIYIYPPTPAFGKAGAAPGTTQVWNLFLLASNASMLRSSFAQALWPQAFVVRALKPAVCVHGPLTLTILRGSFDQALWPQAVVVRALKHAVCLHGPLFLGRSSLPFNPAVCQASNPLKSSAAASTTGTLVTSMALCS